MSDSLTSSKAAYRLTHVLNAFATAHGTTRFPVDVVSTAKDAASIFGWSDPIAEVQAADIPGFEGALYLNDQKQNWLLLYNNRLKSPGRVRFTQAHELGHYLLHRTRQSAFECSEADMVDLTEDALTIEAQADDFAGCLLMPADDLRAQMKAAANFDALGFCADRYGVSLTAMTLRWLKHTDVSAVLVVHRDGYMLWAYASGAARRSGAFFKTRASAIEVPSESVAANPQIGTERVGVLVPAQTWFPNASKEIALLEMKICADQFDYVMTLLVLPRSESVWGPRCDSESTGPAVNRF